jgi:hypothetical protein
MALTIKKESLIDWFVEDDSKPPATRVVARITKTTQGYHVALRLFDFKEPYFFQYFKEAKACALDPASQPD